MNKEILIAGTVQVGGSNQTDDLSRDKVVHQLLEKTERHMINLITINQEGCFQERLRPRSEESVTILSGKGRLVIGDISREVTPMTLVKLTAGKVQRLFNDQVEPLTLLYVSDLQSECSSSELESDNEKPYIRAKVDCDLFVGLGQGESVYELFGKYNGKAQNQSVAIVEFLKVGFSPRHEHPDTEESYWITRGVGTVVIDDKVSNIKPGVLVKIPMRSLHQVFANAVETHDEGALQSVKEEPFLQLIAVCAPAWTLACMVCK